VFRQDGTSKGMTNDTLRLIRDDLKAKAASVGVEKAPASNIDFLGFVPAPLNSECALVAKGGKWVPLPGFSPTSSLCNSEVVRGSVYNYKGKTVSVGWFD
jgi:hypothetical protein